MELSKTKAALYASLSTKKMRQKHKLFIAEGEKCVADFSRAFTLECIVVKDGYVVSEAFPVGNVSEKIFTADEKIIKKISTLSTPSDVIAVFRMPEEEAVSRVSAGKLYLLLDGIQDPGNLGTIIRTADWFGIDTIFASHDTVDAYNPKTVQSTMGSLGRVRVIYTDLCSLIESNSGIPVFGMLLEGENIYRKDLSSEGFIIMGNEGNGISSAVRKKITEPLLIPPYNDTDHAESLNVAIATAITLSIFRKEALCQK